MKKYGQSRFHSIIEQLVATTVKFLWAMVIWQFLAWHILGQKMPLSDNFLITGIFTVNSLLIGYWFRRIFNWIHENELF